jgi:uncharacterized protein YlxP (DUF503 family)
MPVGILNIHLHLPGCSSLKEKRSRIKPLLSRLHSEYNISVSEIEHQDIWQDTTIACALVSNDSRFIQSYLQKVLEFIEKRWPDVDVIDQSTEIIH